MRRPEVLQVGGLEPFSTTDWPGRLSAVVFVQGCPWRCGYCHNPGLQPRARPEGVPDWDGVLRFLQRRQGLLDAVVFSGGEPTIDPGLGEAVAQARVLGFQVGLHTAGIHLRRLAAVLPQLDWVGLDLKADAPSYDGVTGVPGSAGTALQALALLARSGVALEVRTTVDPQWLGEAELLDMARLLQDAGVRRWMLQRRRWLAGDGAAATRWAPPPSEALMAAFAAMGLQVGVR